MLLSTTNTEQRNWQLCATSAKVIAVYIRTSADFDEAMAVLQQSNMSEAKGSKREGGREGWGVDYTSLASSGRLFALSRRRLLLQ